MPVKKGDGKLSGKPAQGLWALMGKALDLGQTPTLVTDEVGCFVYANLAAQSLLGWGLDKLCNLRLADIAPDLHTTPFDTSEPHARVVETKVTTKSGASIDVELHGVAVAHEGHTLRVWTLHDLTPFKRQQTALQERAQLWRTLLDEFPLVVWMKDRDSRIQVVNAAYVKEVKASSQDALVGRSEFDFCPSDLAELYVASDKVVMASGRAQYLEEPYVDANNQRRWMEVWKSPLHSHGKIVGTVGYSRDITERKKIESELQKALALAQGVIDASPDLLFETNRQGRYLNVWTRNPELLAASREQLLGRTVHEVLTPENAEICELAYIEAETFGVSLGRVISVSTPVGLRYFELSVSQKPRLSDEMPHFITISRDVTERLRLQQELTDRERQYRSLVEHSPDVIARFDLKCFCRFANPVLLLALDKAATDVIGKTPQELWGTEAGIKIKQQVAITIKQKERTEFEYHWEDTANRHICSLVSLTPEIGDDGAVSSVLMVGRDITELKAYQDKIHQMAFFDALTGMPNRVLFNDRMSQLLKDAAYHHFQLGVMLVDLDRFKHINDTMGHASGDALLVEVARRLRASVRTYDTVARLGGDEFGILLPRIRDGAHLTRVAGKVQAAFKQSFWLEGQEIFVSCSVGIAVYPTDSRLADELLKYADSAMYSAKRSGRNDFRFYSSDLTIRAKERLRLEIDLFRALERGELEVHYQPKVLVQSGEVVGCEALLRWNHASLGLVPPSQFIPVAEDAGLIHELGAWVLQEACATAVLWNARGTQRKVAVNMSVRQIQTHDMVARVKAILEQTQCSPQWLEIEITESLLLGDDTAVLETLEALRAMGITIAIDDFGTGYSALAYLSRFPIDVLKIDRSFIQSATTDNFRAELIRSILSIARCLNQQVVAEGVETSEQADFLLSEGCLFAQGFLYGKAIPRQQLLALST